MLKPSFSKRRQDPHQTANALTLDLPASRMEKEKFPPLHKLPSVVFIIAAYTDVLASFVST